MVVMPHRDSDQDKRSNQVIQQCVSVQQCARPITAGAHSCGRLYGVLRRVSFLCPVTHMAMAYSEVAWVHAQEGGEGGSQIVSVLWYLRELGTPHQPPSEYSKAISSRGLDRVIVRS